MATEQIGLEAVLKDADFQKGLAAYLTGVDKATHKTEEGAEKMSVMEKASAMLGSGLSAVGSIAVGAFTIGIAAATAAVAGLVFAAKTGFDATTEWAGQLDKLGDQFGLSGEKASGWAFLMNRVGISVDEGAQGLNFFTRGLNETTKLLKDGKTELTPFGQALAKLGVSAFDAKGKLKTFDQVMPEILDKFQKLPAGVNASALSMELFGARGGSKFLDFLRQGSSGLKDATAKAKEYGLSLSTDNVNAVEEFGFAQNELNLALKGIWNQVGIALLPVLKELGEFISKEILPTFTKWAKDNAPAITKALRDLGKWIMEVGLPALQKLVPLAMSLFKFLSTPPNTAGFNKIMQIFAPIFKELSRFWVEIEPKVTKAWENIQKVTSQVWDYVWNKIIKPIVTAITKFIDDNMDTILSVIGGVWKQIQGVFQVAWSAIQGIVKVALDILGGDFEAAGQDWQEMQRGIWAGIQLIFSGAWDILKGIVTLGFIAIVNSITAGATNLTNAITKPFNDAIAYINGLNWSAIGTSIVTAITTALNNALNVGGAVLTAIQNLASGIGTAIANAIGNIGSINIRDAFALIIASALNSVMNFWAWATMIYNSVKDIVSNIANQFVNFVGTMATALYDLISRAIKDILHIPYAPSTLAPNSANGNAPALAMATSGASIVNYGGTVNNYYNLNVNSMTPTSTLVSDFGILKSLAQGGG